VDCLTGMRGAVEPQADIFCLISAESRVPKDHPLRGIKGLMDAALKNLSPLFDEMYASEGRPSVGSPRRFKPKPSTPAQPPAHQRVVDVAAQPVSTEPRTATKANRERRRNGEELPWTIGGPFQHRPAPARPRNPFRWGAERKTGDRSDLQSRSVSSADLLFTSRSRSRRAPRCLDRCRPAWQIADAEKRRRT